MSINNDLYFSKGVGDPEKFRQQNADAYWNRLGKKLKVLNEKNIPFAEHVWLRKIIAAIVNVFIPRETQKVYAHLTAEHLSKKTLSGLHPMIGKSYARLKAILKTMNSSQAQLAYQALDYSWKIEQINAIPIIGVHLAVAQVKKDIKSLQQGQFLLLPCGYTSYPSGHTMMLHVECVQNDLGKKTYCVTVHNTGEGINAYHSSRVNDEGFLRYQTGMRIGSIQEEDLAGENAPFFYKIFSHQTVMASSSIDAVYADLHLLKGTILPPLYKKKAWAKGQFGGSCETQSKLSALKQVLGNEYDEFLSRSSGESLQYMYGLILQGDGQSLTKKVALETIRKMIRNKERFEIPVFVLDELKKVKTKIRDMERAEMQEKRDTLEKSLRQPDLHLNGIATQCHFDSETQKFNGVRHVDFLNLALAYFKIGDLKSAKNQLLQATEIPLPQSEESFKIILILIQDMLSISQFNEEEYTLKEWSFLANWSAVIIGDLVSWDKSLFEESFQEHKTAFDRLFFIQIIYHNIKVRTRGGNFFLPDLERAQAWVAKNISGNNNARLP